MNPESEYKMPNLRPTLSEHNRRQRSAGVLCDKCGAEMDWQDPGHMQPNNVPVKCPVCGATGLKRIGW